MCGPGDDAVLHPDLLPVPHPVYACKLSDREHPLHLRLAAGPRTDTLSFVLREHEIGEVSTLLLYTVHTSWSCFIALVWSVYHWKREGSPVKGSFLCVFNC